jgi:hypothetical protein
MVEGKKYNLIDILEISYLFILLVIFGGIVLHAPISVGFGVLFPDYDLLIKSWKEILMLIAGVILLVILFKTKKLKLLRDPIIIAVGTYATLHLVLLAYQPTGLASGVAGLIIDLRYVLYFSLVYLALRLYPKYINNFIKVGAIGALIVLIFALMQVFVLPADVLKYIGYSVNTVSPYLTVDQNNDYIRINSTLRGPNPLGAYAGMVLVLIVAFISRWRIKSFYDQDKRLFIVVSILSAGGLVALWFSYSRSALVATAIAIFIVLALSVKRRSLINKWVISSVVIIAIIGGLAVSSNSQFISNVIFHDNPNDNNSLNSNEGHFGSLQNGFERMLYQPLGGGIGSTGSASLLGDQPQIIENQYLFTAHESGWLGLIYFVGIFGFIMVKLWRLRTNWLSLGVLASGIGLALIGLLLPVWVDDTVSIVWWGLAAIATGGGWQKGNWKLGKEFRES